MRSETELDTNDEIDNPLDIVEDVLHHNNWIFNRINDDELMVVVNGKSCTYNLYFYWQDDLQALSFCCQYDLSVNHDCMDKAARTLLTINENLWMGHFEIAKHTAIPTFRQTCLYRGLTGRNGNGHIEDLVDIALTQCERNYPVFYLLSHANDAQDDHLALAMMPTAGES
jgi:hypothetical protein